MGQFDRKPQSEPKHGKPSSSGAYKGPPVMARGMPIHRKGPSYTPKKKAKQPAPNVSATPEPLIVEHILPLELEKRTLEIFRTTFPASNDFDALKPTLHEIKDALNCRDFETAFGKEEYLEAYAIRWGPSRTLGYAQLLAWVFTQRTEDECVRQLINSTDHQTATKAVCFGGAAAELMALSGLLRHLRPSEAAGKPDQQDAQISEDLDASSMSTGVISSPLLRLNLLDAADWTSVLSKLKQGLLTPPTLSKYASTTVRTSNVSFLSPGIAEHVFTRTDILSLSTEDLRTAIGTAPALLTLISTLNELYTTSMPRTTAFLRRLQEATPKGSLLLVVDSPGAYSEVAAVSPTEGEVKRKYPMNLLLDYALLPKPREVEGSEDDKPERAWEKVIDEASMLYKLDDALKYPVSLENSRFQVHLFKRI
jgi:25S rRNA (uracil2843-N3)-methyltransferase